MTRLLFALLLLTACTEQPAPAPLPSPTPTTALEAAAIEAGLVVDPASTDITGLYARDTDRVCIVPGATAYRIGVYVDYDDNQSCAGSGVATRAGEALELDFPSAPGCTFTARYEGDRIAFPGKLPEPCAKLCHRRASLAALNVDRLSESPAEASTLRDAKGRLLCSLGG
ncbi:hypothetical protein [Sphingomonas sp. PB4P5]|uniref:hypothetical protein n=1 Tax=Parasphingomonas puruogangriensis TaxID=3096155 RepID=UPI002FCA208D